MLTQHEDTPEQWKDPSYLRHPVSITPLAQLAQEVLVGSPHLVSRGLVTGGKEAGATHLSVRSQDEPGHWTPRPHSQYSPAEFQQVFQIHPKARARNV